MEYKEFTAKNVDEAITEACESLLVTSDKLDYEVVSAGSAGLLGIGAKPAVIKARIKEEKEETVETKVEVKEEKKPEVKAEKKAASSDINGDELCKKANDFLKEVKKANCPF